MYTGSSRVGASYTTLPYHLRPCILTFTKWEGQPRSWPKSRGHGFLRPPVEKNWAYRGDEIWMEYRHFVVYYLTTEKMRRFVIQGAVTNTRLTKYTDWCVCVYIKRLNRYTSSSSIHPPRSTKETFRKIRSACRSRFDNLDIRIITYPFINPLSERSESTIERQSEF